MTKEDKNTLRLELLGIGSLKNRRLKANLMEALDALGINLPVAEVTQISELMQYDISGIPALVINGQVVFQRIVPEVEDLKILLSTFLKTCQVNLSFRNILVPIDFSSAAQNAFFYARKLAKQEGALLKLVHVEEPRVEWNHPYQIEPPSPIKNDPPWERSGFIINNDQERSALSFKKEKLEGFAVDEIVRLSSAGETDLIVMGSRKKSGLMQRWFGSTSSEVARKANCPVLLVPEGASFKGFGHIVYASDFHPMEEQILPGLISMANRYEAAVHFVHVEQNKLNGYIVLSTGGGKVFNMGGETSLKMTVVECEDVLHGLNHYAKDHQADLMVMATTRRNFFEDLFHKSVTRKMIFNTKIPLLIVHFEDMKLKQE